MTNNERRIHNNKEIIKWAKNNRPNVWIKLNKKQDNREWKLLITNPKWEDTHIYIIDNEKSVKRMRKFK